MCFFPSKPRVQQSGDRRSVAPHRHRAAPGAPLPQKRLATNKRIADQPLFTLLGGYYGETQMVTSASLRACNKCGVMKEPIDFRPCSIQSRFYTCKSCCDQKNSERRRKDPATRLATRLRARGCRIGVGDIRRMLDTLDPLVVENDQVVIMKLRKDQPFTPENAVACVRTAVGRLVVTAG